MNRKCGYFAMACVLVASASAVQAASNIAVISVASIFSQLPQRAQVGKQLESEFKGRANQLHSMEQDLKNKVQKLQRNGTTMKASERSALEKQIVDERQQFADKAQKFEQDNQRRQAQERDKLISRIQAAAQKIAEQKGYDMVIDSNAVVYAKSANDITTDVLKQVK